MQNKPQRSNLSDQTRWLLFAIVFLLLSACSVLEQRKAQATADAEFEVISQKIIIAPPSEGFFIVNDDFTLTEINFKQVPAHNLAEHYYQMPEVARKPVFVFSSTNKDPAKFNFYRARPMTGFIVDLDQSPCRLDQGVILSVDGIHFDNCRQIDDYVKTKNILDPIEYELRRGTQTTTTNTQLDKVTWRDEIYVPMNQEWYDNYIAFYSLQNLSPGVYCYYWPKALSVNGYCFRVTE